VGDKAYVIHSQRYSETSVLVDLFIRGEGVVRVLHRGAKRKRQMPLQPGIRYEIQRVGKSGLKSLASAEPEGDVQPIVGEHQYILFYLNEVCQRIVSESDLSVTVFEQYQAIVDALKQGLDVENYLRSFELRLLFELGYGVSVLNAPQDIDITAEYGLTPNGDIVCLPSSIYVYKQPRITGAQLKAIAIADWSCVENQRAAKQLTRAMIAIRLGGKPLKSRELYIKYKEATVDQSTGS